MISDILICIDNLADYRIVLEAVTGDNAPLSDSKAQALLAIYKDNADSGFGFQAQELVTALLVLDMAPSAGDRPAHTSRLAELLAAADRDGLDTLIALCGGIGQPPELAMAAKEAALAEGVSGALALALARAALDVLAAQSDLAPWREAIGELAAVLTDADEDQFAQASRFLVQLRKWCRRGRGTV